MMSDFATPSDYSSIFDKGDYLSDFEDSSLGAWNVIPYEPGDIEVLYLDSDSDYKNIVKFTGTFRGSDVELVIPYSEYSYLSVVDGKLINVGPSQVSGRLLFSGDTINPSDYEYHVYNLNPVYGSSNSVYQYGSFNFDRYYYLNSSGSYDRITYDDTYGDFIVTDIDIYFSSSERVYYLGLVILFMMGVLLLCLRRKH